MRALAKAERVKDETAAAVRNLNSGQASADERAAAEAAYREAADALKRLRDGTSQTEPADDKSSADNKTPESEDEETVNEPA